MLISIIIISHIWSNCMYMYAFALFGAFFSPSSSSSSSSSFRLFDVQRRNFVFFSLLYLPDYVRSLLFRRSFFLQVKLTQRTSTRLVHSILFPSRHCALGRRRRSRRRREEKEEKNRVGEREGTGIVSHLYIMSKMRRSDE